MSQARFSIRTAVAEGLGFWRANVLRAIGPMLLAMAGLVALLFGKTTLLVLAGLAVYLLAGVVVQGALYRLALGAGDGSLERPGRLGFQWTMHETRLAIVGLLFALILAVGLFLAGQALNLIGVALVGADGKGAGVPIDQALSNLGPVSSFAYTAAGLILVGGLFVLNARLSLAAPATIQERKIRFFGVIGLSRGSALRIVSASFIALSPVIIGQFLAGWYVEAFPGPDVTAKTQLIVGFVSTFLYMPISVGMTSHIYRRLRGAEGQ